MQRRLNRAERQLNRLIETNRLLTEDLQLERIPVSEASQSIIEFTTTKKDYLLKSIWGKPPVDPFTEEQDETCCSVM
ncbi:Guanine nucleotide-binding protein subunit gamma [Smittium culicis]|uniref:Guanine nucleotide-binding protein subunit gamma n=1 Tax=Smittium culicis TaxID=133412 RepID=A0A1R1YJ73_9FUNG|nr:Guanine nucleotide-binding protein subunit gamma [Smittium culicis]OMJ26845.1 Guanine nucleotide-binding protein subunit gamma [Smittium culicis]